MRYSVLSVAAAAAAATATATAVGALHSSAVLSSAQSSLVAAPLPTRESGGAAAAVNVNVTNQIFLNVGSIQGPFYCQSKDVCKEASIFCGDRPTDDGHVHCKAQLGESCLCIDSYCSAPLEADSCSYYRPEEVAAFCKRKTGRDNLICVRDECVIDCTPKDSKDKNTAPSVQLPDDKNCTKYAVGNGETHSVKIVTVCYRQPEAQAQANDTSSSSTTPPAAERSETPKSDETKPTTMIPHFQNAGSHAVVGHAAGLLALLFALF